MLIEASVITIVILASAVLFRGSGNKHFSVAVLPLTILPIMHILGYVFVNYVITNSAYAVNIQLGFDVAGAVISGIILSIVGDKFKNNKNKIAYKTMSGIFTLVLALAFILNYI